MPRGGIVKHGMCQSLEYKTWTQMKRRCREKPNYVNKGITVCPQWINSFEQFYADMGDKPTPNHTIDRINNDLGYEPGNCRWATAKEQIRNRSCAHNYTYKGVTQTVLEWAEEYDLEYHTLLCRLKRGWQIERALNTPPRKNSR